VFGDVGDDVGEAGVGNDMAAGGGGGDDDFDFDEPSGDQKGGSNSVAAVEYDAASPDEVDDADADVVAAARGTIVQTPPAVADAPIDTTTNASASASVGASKSTEDAAALPATDGAEEDDFDADFDADFEEEADVAVKNSDGADTNDVDEEQVD